MRYLKITVLSAHRKVYYVSDVRDSLVIKTLCLELQRHLTVASNFLSLPFIKCCLEIIKLTWALFITRWLRDTQVGYCKSGQLETCYVLC